MSGRRRFTLYCFIILLCFPVSSAYAQNVEGKRNYKLTASILFQASQTLSIKYTNMSKDMHCIRVRDLGGIFANAFIIRSNILWHRWYLSRSNSDGFPSDMIKPDQFYVVPPRTHVSALVTLGKYYHFWKGKYNIRYYIPVLNCDGLKNGYIDIPPPHHIAAHVRDRNAEIAEIYEFLREFYPVWADNGFIAEMDTVELVVK